MEFEEFDRQLKSRGWRYDAGNEEFRDGERRLEWEDVVGLVPGSTLHEPASYQDEKHDDAGARRTLEHSQ